MTTITLPRAVVEQALETIEGLTRDRLFTAEWAGKHGATITALRAALAHQAEPVEPVAHRVVAGALFDFMGWLTSRRERLVLSSTDDAAPAADAIKDFAEMRGLSLDDAKVQDWNAALAQQAEPVQEPAYKVKVAGRWHDTEPLAPAFSLPDGEHLLYTAPPQRKPLTEEVAALIAQRNALLEAYRKMKNVAAGYSNLCDGSAFTRKLEREFEAADAIARAAIKAVKEGK